MDNPSPPKSEYLTAVESRDDGKTWQIIGYIPVPGDIKVGRYGLQEPHVVETSDAILTARLALRLADVANKQGLSELIRKCIPAYESRQPIRIN